MKITIDFEDDDDPKQKLLAYLKVDDLMLALRDVRERLRNTRKRDFPVMNEEDFYDIILRNKLEDLDI